MRRLLNKFTLAAAATAFLGFGTACEDGPSQTYTAPPPGAGAVWNGGSQTGITPASTYVPPGSQSLDASTQGGTNANVLCTASEVHDRRVKYFGAPISPPGLGAGLDIAGGPNADCASGYGGPGTTFTYDATKETWTGCTVEQAEAILCQGTNVSNIFTGVTTTVAWGDAEEVAVLYNANNRVVTDVLLQTGYEGAVSAASVDGTTTYILALNNAPMQIKTASGTTQVFLDWNSAGGNAKISSLVEGMYDALRNKFSPDIPSDCTGAVPSTCHCVDKGHCIIGNNGAGGAYFWFVPLGFIPFVSTTIGSMQADSVFTLIDQEKLKLLPFSNADVTMKFDAVGPTAISPNIAGTTKTCNYQLGMKFSDFDANCVEVFASATTNAIAAAKLYGSLGHSDEAYSFDVVGVDPNFVATTIPDNSVIFDNSTCAQTPGAVGCPAPNDTAYALNVDQQFLGTLTNDSTNNDATQPQDFHGIGLVTLETAWLVQKYMQAVHGVTTDLGDPDCLVNPAAPATPGKICSGIEGILTSAPAASIKGLTGLTGNAATQMTINAIGVAATSVDGNIAIGLKPGTWHSAVCADGGGLDSMGMPVGYAQCSDDYYFTELQNAVAASYPPGVPVPADVADRRFYFQQFILASVKYFHSAADPNATIATIDANVALPDDLFFDSNGGGFESGIYVDRLNVNSLGQAPTVYTVGTNLTTSVLNNFDFERYNFRGERLVYTAMTTNPSDKPGAEGQLITNLVGSPVLQSVYPAYACAINSSAAPNMTNAGCCTDQTGAPCATVAVAPLDPNTNNTTPLYKAYAGAFGQSFLHIAANGAPVSASPMVVTTAGFELIQSAQVSVPTWSNPYDPTTATAHDTVTTVLVPYFPKSANVGFPVTLDGSRDKFYNSYNVDLTGTSFNGNVDYDFTSVPTDGGFEQELIIRAVETQNYLGQVFMCAEPSPADPAANCNPFAAPIQSCDILSVRMYDNATEILDYLTKHPTATSDCGITIKYSIYGNYADYISSLTNGIRFGLNPGFGGAVVSDVTLFDPNVVAGLGS